MRSLLLCLILMLFPFRVARAEWVTYPARRDSPDYGPIVTDIEKHLPRVHDYRDKDKTSWVHEGTHGINGQLRSKYQRPSFYRLYDRAFVLRSGHPRTTLAAVAKQVPKAYRRGSWKSYCIEAQPWYNNESAFLFDEWSACLNQAVARWELKLEDTTRAGEKLIDIAISSTCVAYCSGSDDPELKIFLREMWEQTLIYIDPDALQPLRTDTDAVNLYNWMKGYFGDDWVVMKIDRSTSYILWNNNVR